MDKVLKTGALLVGGALASYAVNKMLSPEERKKTQAQVKKMMAQIDWNLVSEQVFGQKSEAVRKQLQKTVGNFQDQLIGVKSRMNNIDVPDYDRLVDDFTKKLEDDKDFTKAQVKKLGDYLRTDFKSGKSTAKA